MIRRAAASLAVVAVVAAVLAAPGPAAAADSADPVGVIDKVGLDGTTLTIAGWTYDPDTPNRPNSIHIYLDGRLVKAVSASTSRPDVAAAFGIDARHGYNLRLTVAPGPHTACIYTINTTPGPNPLLGCRSASPQLGVLVTPTGVVTPIREVLANGWRVTTPCGAEAVLNRGTVITGAMVVLDPGHGGPESGSVGPNGLIERDLNLAVAVEAKRQLEARGISVVLTRQADHSLPIQIRAEIANALDPALFMSIHHNGGFPPRSSRPGTEVFVDANDPEARRAGGILYDELVRAAEAFPTAWVASVRAGVSVRRGANGDDFYGIHRRTPGIPSVISEFLWLSNGPEAALLARRDMQIAEATAIARGIARWLGTNDIGRGFLPDFIDTKSDGSGGFASCREPALT